MYLISLRRRLQLLSGIVLSVLLIACAGTPETGQQPVPDPPCEVFAGRVFKSIDVIQAVVVELVEQGLECPSQIGKIHHPARFLAYRAADVYFDSKGVPVQAGALVPFGNVGQPVSGFDLKNAKNIHKRIVTLMD